MSSVAESEMLPEQCFHHPRPLHVLQTVNSVLFKKVSHKSFLKTISDIPIKIHLSQYLTSVLISDVCLYVSGQNQVSSYRDERLFPSTAPL